VNVPLLSSVLALQTGQGFLANPLTRFNPDTVNRLGGSGARKIKAREATVEKLLTTLGQFGVALAPSAIIHAKSETPAQDRGSQRRIAGVHPAGEASSRRA
jgi:hypothetical protein